MGLTLLTAMTASCILAFIFRARLASYVGLESGPSIAWSEVQATIRAGDWPEAERLIGGWVEENPADGRAWLLLANLRAGRNDAAGAAQAARRVAPGDPAFVTARMLEADLALRDLDAPRAEAIAREAAELAPRAPEPRRRLIFLLSTQQRPAEARDALWDLYRIVGDPRLLVDLVLEATKSEADARGIGPEVDQYLGRTPADPFLRRARGLARLWAGRPGEALEDLRAAADALIDDPLGRFALAECRLQLGQPVRVPEDLGAEPDGGTPADRARWWVFRGRLEEAAGRPADALSSFLRAVELDERSHEARFRLAEALARSGDSGGAAARRAEAEAIRRRDDALRKRFTHLRSHGYASDAGLFLQLADQCRDAGLGAEARAWTEQARKLDPTRDMAVASSDAPYPFPLSRPRRAGGGGLPGPFPPSESRLAEAPGSPTTSEAVVLRDIAAEAGLDFTYDHGPRDDLYLADTMGGGVALLDYDGDGRLDVYFVNGCRIPFDRADAPRPNRLFRNLGGWKFEDVTARAGVGGLGYGMGATVADYDGDGDDDLFVTGIERAILYQNNGDGTFRDATDAAGVACQGLWSTAAGFGDLDGDGDLDLMVVTYVEDDPAVPRACRDHAGKPIHCSPGQYLAQPDGLFRNEGDGTFSDVGASSGIAAAENGRGLGLAVADLDGDGRLDLYVANDASRDFFFRNRGGMLFEELGETAGLAYDGSGHATASMGVAAEDLDGDGLVDLFHTNFLNEPNTLHRNLGGGMFADATLAARLAAPSVAVTGFGVAAEDLNNDGYLDLFVANGHVDDQPWVNSPMAQRPLLFLGGEGGRFELADSSSSSPYLGRPVVGRGVAAGDLDGDGKVDLVVVHRGAPAALLRNETPGGHAIEIDVRGAVGQGTPIGAVVTVETAGRVQVRPLTSGTGYLSQHGSRLHFGLGAADSVDRIEVRWPDGTSRTFPDAPANRLLKAWRDQADPSFSSPASLPDPKTRVDSGIDAVLAP